MRTELEHAVSQLKRAVSKKAEATTRNVASAETRRYHDRVVRDATKKVYRLVNKRRSI